MAGPLPLPHLSAFTPVSLKGDARHVAKRYASATTNVMTRPTGVPGGVTSDIGYDWMRWEERKVERMGKRTRNTPMYHTMTVRGERGREVTSAPIHTNTCISPSSPCHVMTYYYGVLPSLSCPIHHSLFTSHLFIPNNPPTYRARRRRRRQRRLVGASSPPPPTTTGQDACAHT